MNKTKYYFFIKVIISNKSFINLKYVSKNL